MSIQKNPHLWGFCRTAYVVVSHDQESEKTRFFRLWYLNGSKAQTNQYSLFANLLDGFKEKASVLDAIFSHIEYSDILRDRFAKANIFTNEASNY